MSEEEIIFESLPMRKRALVPLAANQYSIQPKTGESIKIEANTAYEAFKLSGCTDAIKIERTSYVGKIIFNNSQFVDDRLLPKDENSGLPDDEDPAEQLKHRKNPVISANDLDTIMKSLQEANAAMEAKRPTEEIPTTDQAAGQDVQGDGFDEIIPSKVKTMATVAYNDQDIKPPVTENTPPNPADVPPQPEKALSQEEIEKLLNGN